MLSRCQNSRLCLCISELMDKRHDTVSLWTFNRDDMLWERDWRFQTSRWERGALSGPLKAFIRGGVTCIIKFESSIKLKCNFRRHLPDRSSLPLNPSQRHEYHIPPRSRWSTTEKFMLSIITHFLWICFTSVSSFSPFSLSPSPFPSPPSLLASRPLDPAVLPPPRSSSQASNGQSSGYAYSLPSTPVVAHRDLRVAQGEGVGSVNSRSLKNIPRRPSLFKVSPMSHTF